MNSRKPFNYLIVTILLIVVTSLLSNAISAQYYWVGGSGNWSDYATHWATSSGGTTFHTTAPTSNDDVIFDANSFTQTGQVVIVDATQANCRTMDWTGVLHNPGFESLSASTILNIFGSFILSPDMTCTLRYVEFEGGTTGNNIRTYGTDLGAFAIIRFMGTGSWNFLDVLNVYSIQFLSGTIHTNNNTLNVTSMMQISGTSAKEFNAGSSILIVGSWNMSATNTTLNMGTSTIIANGFYGDGSSAGPFTYYNVELNQGGLLNDNCTINKLTLGNGGYEGSAIVVESGATIQFSELLINSSLNAPLNIRSSEVGSEAYFSKSSGAVTGDFVILQDIHAIGGATFTLNSSFDMGNNTGWTINAIVPEDFYWVGNTGNWSDFSTHWATSSGGSTFHNRVPSQFDHVYFDANSFTLTGQTVTVDSIFSCASIDFTGAGNNPVFYAAYGDVFSVYGSVNFIENMSGSIYNIIYTGENAVNTIMMGGVYAQNSSFSGSSEWTLLGDLSTANLGFSESCTFNTNGYDVSVYFTFSQNRENVNLNFGSSTISAKDFILGNSSFDFDAGTSTIHVTRNFDGGGYSFYKLVMEEEASVVDQNTFEFLEILPGTTASFEAGSTQTVNQSLVLSGTSGSPINISSNSSGSQATISMAGGTVNGNWLILQDMNASGGATFNAMESVDNGNNTGWNIYAPVAKDFYWVGGSGNWSDFSTHWATSSGGSTFHVRVPGSLDNVFFDTNSFNGSGQQVIIDSDEITFHSMSWEGATDHPALAGNNKAMNIYGSLTLIENMDISVTNYNFFSAGSETITAGKSSNPGTSSYIYFLGGGEWALQDSLTTREIHLENGTFKTNGNWMHIDFAFYFTGDETKVLDLGTSSIFTRTMQWWNSGDNLTFNGANSKISFSSEFTPVSDFPTNVHVNLGDLYVVRGRYQDVASINSTIVVDTLLIEAGKTLKILGFKTVTSKQFIAVGTEEEHISLSCVNEGVKAEIIQTSGTVDGYYLELKDITASGGAAFNAYNSLDLGNVSGWTFYKASQAITFPAIPDKEATDDPFTISATASSGLPVSFEILSGPATIDGATITLTGEAGVVQVQASQEGNEDYLPAPSVKQSFSVGYISQTITFEDIPDKYTTDEAFTISVSSTSGLDVTVEILSGPATISGNLVTLTGETGTVRIQASQEGNDTYSPAEPVIQSFEVALANGVPDAWIIQVSTWPNPAMDKLFVDAPSPTEEMRYEIIDTRGRVIKAAVLTNNCIEVSSLMNGIYILKLSAGETIFYNSFIKTDKP